MARRSARFLPPCATATSQDSRPPQPPGDGPSASRVGGSAIMRICALAQILPAGWRPWCGPPPGRGRQATFRCRGPKPGRERAHPSSRRPKNRYLEGFARVCQAPFSRQKHPLIYYLYRSALSRSVLYTFEPRPRVAGPRTRASAGAEAPSPCRRPRDSGLRRRCRPTVRVWEEGQSEETNANAMNKR